MLGLWVAGLGHLNGLSGMGVVASQVDHHDHTYRLVDLCLKGPMRRQAYAELSSNPLQYELERLNKETDKRSKLRPSGETKRILLLSSRVAQRKINDGSSAVQE